MRDKRDGAAESDGASGQLGDGRGQVDEYAAWVSGLGLDPDMFAGLVREAAAQVARTGTFPWPKRFDRWSDEAVEDFVGKVFAKRGKGFALKILEKATSQKSLELLIVKTVRNVLIDEANRDVEKPSSQRGDPVECAVGRCPGCRSGAPRRSARRHLKESARRPPRTSPTSSSQPPACAPHSAPTGHEDGAASSVGCAIPRTGASPVSLLLRRPLAPPWSAG